MRLSPTPLEQSAYGTKSVIDPYPERANLYPLTLEPPPTQLFGIRKTTKGKVREEVYFEPIPGTKPTVATVRDMRRALMRSVIEGLERVGYKISRKFSKIIKTDTNYAPSAGASLKIYSAFKPQVLYIRGYYYLCLDHQLIIRATLSLASLMRLD